jgi:hypothetical protein
MVVILKAFVEYCVLLILGHPFEFSWLDVSQQTYLIDFSSLTLTQRADQKSTTGRMFMDLRFRL